MTSLQSTGKLSCLCSSIPVSPVYHPRPDTLPSLPLPPRNKRFPFPSFPFSYQFLRIFWDLFNFGLSRLYPSQTLWILDTVRRLWPCCDLYPDSFSGGFQGIAFCFYNSLKVGFKNIVASFVFCRLGFHSKSSQVLPKCPTREPHYQVCFCYGVYSFLSIGYLHILLQFQSHLRTLGSCLFPHFPWKHNAKPGTIAHACSHSTLTPEAGGWQILGEPGLSHESLSQQEQQQQHS